MPITEFRTFSDGVPIEMRRRDEYLAQTNLDDECLWIPYVPGVHFQACNFNVTNGGFANILRVQPGTQLPAHYHISTVHGFTLRGTWHYREHSWVATPGSYIYEPAGEAHTLLVDADATEPMMTFFVLSGGLIYVDNVVDGKVVGYDDGFTLLELARKHYRETGMDLALIDAMVR